MGLDKQIRRAIEQIKTKKRKRVYMIKMKQVGPKAIERNRGAVRAFDIAIYQLEAVLRKESNE
jgi:hypothetical protein